MAPKIGERIAKGVKSGRKGYRQARQIADKHRSQARRAHIPPDLSTWARRTCTLLAACLKDDSLGDRLQRLAEYAEYLEPRERRALVSGLDSLSATAKRRADGFRFCAEPSCDLAYYRPQTEDRVYRKDVSVRIGQKETTAPRPLCYCFGHTIEDIEAQVAVTGTSTIPDEITAKCRQGLDRCEETNPQGSCCLGSARKVREDAEARRASGTSAAVAPLSGHADDCCAVKAPPSQKSKATVRNAGVWATGGAVVSAILSSACCWLPLLLIAFGASAAGVAGFFEAYRPYLLAAAALLLAGGFYLAYFRKERCEPGQACAVPNPRLIRFNKVMLWVASVVVLLFALFPNYVGVLIGGGTDGGSGLVSAQGETHVYRIEGMTCESCAAVLAARLRSTPGILGANVEYREGRATVTLAPDADVQEVLDAIAEQGFEGTVEG